MSPPLQQRGFGSLGAGANQIPVIVQSQAVTAGAPDNAIELEGTTDVIELEGTTDYILREA